MNSFALTGADVLVDGVIVSGQCLVVRAGRIAALTPVVPDGVAVVALDGGLLAPGFIDVQVNGGGGVLFNDQPTVEGIAAIAAAHRRFGTTGFLPTLISDDLDVMAHAISAVDAAILAGVPGVLGIHLEGPFLNTAKKGVHDAARFRAIDSAAVELLSSLKRGQTLVTLAPELAPPGIIEALVARGVVVAAGHTDASYETMTDALARGLSGFTHLFNAMSPLASRAPGAVGAALDTADSWCGMIVDGHHVHPAALRVALRAKGADKCLLVTDAMPPVGTSRTQFELYGAPMTVRDGSCYAADGTLAGSALDMATAVRNCMALLHTPRATALAMASAIPAAFLGIGHQRGTLTAGLQADMVWLDADMQVQRSWIGGVAA